MEPTGPTIDGATAALGTLHGKARQIAPALARAGLKVIVERIDTNAFGTFSGDVPRRGSPEQVVVAKARSAAEAAGIDLGLASEGSFFAHPDVPFITTNLELVALVDRRSGSTVIGRSRQLAPWAHSMTVDRAGLCRVVTSFGLPDQAVLLRMPGSDAASPTGGRAVMDIRTEAQLLAAFRSVVGPGDGPVRVEPDLRADRCPPRRLAIAAAAEDLAARLMRICDGCGSPGVGLERVDPGLPCAWCAGPTLEVLRRVCVCPSCGGESVEAVQGTADAGSCPRCNP